MTPALALLEGGSIFAASWAIAFVWLGPRLADWTSLAPILAQAAGFSFGCVVAFYYNDLYDLGIVPTFERFVTRLPRAIALSVVLLAPFYALLPGEHVARGAVSQTHRRRLPASRTSSPPSTRGPGLCFVSCLPTKSTPAPVRFP